MKRFLFGILAAMLLMTCAPRHPRVIIDTEMGQIVVELFPDKAPITAANFMRYIEEDRWEGATFYRVVTLDNQPQSNTKIQVIQGGLYEDFPPKALPPIPHESTDMTGILHLDGVISMARYQPGTATFEFFICVGDQPSLDAGGARDGDGQGFAAFGRVLKGMEVVRAIQQQPNQDQYLVPRIAIQNMHVVR